MTTKFSWTVNHTLIASLVIAGIVLFVGCSNDTGYTPSRSDGGTTTTQPANGSAKATESSGGMGMYNAAVDRARAEKKSIYLLFTATWCGPCKNYKSTVLSDAEVQRALNKDVVFVSADIDRDKALARKYNVSGVPVGYLLKIQNGEPITANSHVGGLDKQEFMAFIGK
jgi:thiol:disulfide interchange protein